jgi:hypothetical protein
MKMDLWVHHVTAAAPHLHSNVSMFVQRIGGQQIMAGLTKHNLMVAGCVAMQNAMQGNGQCCRACHAASFTQVLRQGQSPRNAPRLRQ